MKSPRQNRKDIACSVIIGSLLTFLPCWIWESAFYQIFVSIMFSVITYLILL